MRAAVVALIFLLAVHSQASDSKLDRETLRGLKSLYVVVSIPADEGLDGVQIQGSIVDRLRSSGIDVTNVDRTKLAHPCLFVTTNVLKRQDGSVVYEISVSLNQEVTIVSNSRSYMAPTWSVSTLASAPGSDFFKFARSDISNLADRFIRAYLEVNRR